MGDRISFSFVNGTEESVAFFSHWRGESLLESVREYLKQLKKTLKKRNTPHMSPIDRLEPNTVMVDFIRWYTKDDEIIDGDLYLGKDENEGDNSDNGHHQFDLILEVKNGDKTTWHDHIKKQLKKQRSDA